MTLIDDTCDGCGHRFDPMGDPNLTRRPTPDSPYRVLCATCVAADRPAESQVWERRIPGTDIPLQRLHLHVDEHGRARVHEAVLAQLLHEAGWERAS